jgi:hypothetical protein
MPRVALVTASARSGTGAASVSGAVGIGGDDDSVLLLDALIWRGVEAFTVAWDDRTVDWSSYDAVVLRSTPDRLVREREFGRWLRRVERRTRLGNSADLVEWNSDRRYLRDLQRAGVAIVPTMFFEPGDLVRMPERGELRVLASVPAGSDEPAHYRLPEDRERAMQHADEVLRSGRAVMVQPFLPPTGDADTAPCSVVYFAGVFSHAVPAVTDEQRSIADRAVTAAGEHGAVLYARVDLVTGARGESLVASIELIDPSLYLDRSDGAADRFADAIATWAGA